MLSKSKEIISTCVSTMALLFNPCYYIGTKISNICD